MNFVTESATSAKVVIFSYLEGVNFSQKMMIRVY